MAKALLKKTAKSTRIDNLKNRIAGVKVIIENTFNGIQDVKSQIRGLIEVREELSDSSSGYLDYADRDRKAFEQNITEANDHIKEFQKSIRYWSIELTALEFELEIIEQIS